MLRLPSRFKMRRPTLLLLLVAVLPVAFQNCGQFTAGDALSSLGSRGFSAPVAGSAESPSLLACSTSLNGTSETGFRRLTKSELVASLTDLFGANVLTSAAVQKAIAQIPDQAAPTGQFTTFDNSIPDVTGLLETSQAIVDQVFASSSAINSTLGGCGADEDICRQSLVTKFAYRAWRRPLSTSEANEMIGLAKSVGGTEGLKIGVMRVLLSPYFHQHVEIGESASTETNRIRLTQFEIASRLSFRLTGTLPDAVLLGEAAAGRLNSLSSLDIQADRLLQTQSARSLWGLFFDRWLELSSTVDPTQTTANEIGISADNLKAETRAEFLKFVDYIIFDKKGSFGDLYTDTTVFPTTDRLAKLFGLPRSDMAVTSSSGFAGLLLRPGILMSASTDTNPILRGIEIRRKFLCLKLPAPSAAIVNERAAAIGKFSHEMYSSRERAARATSEARCASCHQQSNPLGFSLEGFGPLGRPRSEESVYSNSGAVTLKHALDTYVDNLNISQTLTPSANASETALRVSKSAMAKECFSQRLAEAIRLRPLNERDNCATNELRTSLQSGRPILEVLRKSVVTDAIFWKSTDGVQQ